MGEVEELATARDGRLRLKRTWIPCLAVPRTALWQQVNPFAPIFICFPFPLSIGKLRFMNVSQIFKWRWKPHPLAQSLLLQRLVEHVVRTSVRTPGADHKSKTNDHRTIITTCIQAFMGKQSTTSVLWKSAWRLKWILAKAPAKLQLPPDSASDLEQVRRGQ